MVVFRWPKPLFFMVLGAHGNGWRGGPLTQKIPLIFLWLGHFLAVFFLCGLGTPLGGHLTP